MMILKNNTGGKIELSKIKDNYYILKFKVDSMRIGGNFKFVEYDGDGIFRIEVGTDLAYFGFSGIVKKINPLKTTSEHWFELITE